jgi:hypothetical protein
MPLQIERTSSSWGERIECTRRMCSLAAERWDEHSSANAVNAPTHADQANANPHESLSSVRIKVEQRMQSELNLDSHPLLKLAQVVQIKLELEQRVWIKLEQRTQSELEQQIPEVELKRIQE